MVDQLTKDGFRSDDDKGAAMREMSVPDSPEVL